MCPYTYYTAMRENKDPRLLRLRMVRYAEKHGIKPAARYFRTTVKTIRKWLYRYDGTLNNLTEHSRAPRHRPNKLAKKHEKRIVKLKKRLPRWSARRLKDEFELPYSVKAIRRVCKEYGLTHRYRRKKHQTKRYLREIKKTWRLFQQITIDTKDLCDIPEYWPAMKFRRLPQYQYTARDVTTGLLFLGYAQELSLSYATIFAERIIRHLQHCNIDLSQTTWQSDNGSEFIGSWQAKDDSAFTKAIERTPGQKHRTIPPGQHRFQADVETVHSLMETEFYEIETFCDRRDFIVNANAYQLYFNLARKNSGKENKTPWQLILEKNSNADPNLPLLEVVYLDKLLENYLHKQTSGGYDVWALPFKYLTAKKPKQKRLLTTNNQFFQIQLH